jgi:hypothetical protein
VLPPDRARLGQLHRARQQGLVALVLGAVRRWWGVVDAGRPAASWAAVAPLVLAQVSSGQAEAARGAQEYVAAALTLAGSVPDPAGLVLSRAFAGVASDGRDLAGLLGYPAFEVGAFVDDGMPAEQALQVGSRHLARIVTTQVQDAARVATGVATVNDRRVRGYVRVLNLPSCSRCVILAGRWYAYNKGFERHPQCDCVHMPAAEVIEPESPRAVFDAMTDAELRKAGWNAADVQAIREDGADIYQVTNAHRELRSVSIAGQQLRATGFGATRRSLAGKRLGAGRKRQVIRLTPESIYSEARRLGWSRDETIRVLKLHGYIL